MVECSSRKRSPRTTDGFHQTIEHWKRTFLHLDARQEMVDYLTQITKPRQMAVREFVQRLKTLRRYTHMMPTPYDVPAPMFTDDHLKQTVFKAVPNAWRVNFLRIHGTLASVDLLRLQQYLENEREFQDNPAPSTNRNSSPRQRQNNTSGSSNSNNRSDALAQRNSRDRQQNRCRGRSRTLPSASTRTSQLV